MVNQGTKEDGQEVVRRARGCRCVSAGVCRLQLVDRTDSRVNVCSMKASHKEEETYFLFFQKKVSSDSSKPKL